MDYVYQIQDFDMFIIDLEKGRGVLVMSKNTYSKTCIREPPSRLTLNSGWCGKSCLSYNGTCHVILLAKLHDMYLYKINTFPSTTSTTKVNFKGGWLSYTGFTVCADSFNIESQFQEPVWRSIKLRNRVSLLIGCLYTCRSPHQFWW